MNFVAWKMLTGDKAKYISLIFSIAFASFLISQQASIFAGLMQRTTSQIIDVRDAGIWVMDPATQYVDEVKALPDSALYRVRDVRSVAWAVPFFKGQATCRAPDGKFRGVILLGIDDATLVGVPRNMLVGKAEDLERPDAIILDRAGYEYFFPDQPLRTGAVFEMNDRLAVLVGICEASAPFATFPVMYTRFSLARDYVGRERDQLSFVLAKARPGFSNATVCAAITETTGLRAETTDQFGWRTISYYLNHTGIPVNFGITIVVAIIVGAVVAGQTFYIFTLENLKQFGALKAIGVTDLRLVGMILLQALIVALSGFALGLGLAAEFFEVTIHRTATRGFVLLWPAVIGTGVLILVIVMLASLLSIRKVITTEPAIVFRG